MGSLQEGGYMSQSGDTQRNIEEFLRIQRYMSIAGKDSTVYKEMKYRYIELKAVLNNEGVNLNEIDYIKE